MTKMKEIQSFFPSEDGNRESREHFIELLTSVLENMDQFKDTHQVTLGPLKEKSAGFYEELTNSSAVPQKGGSFQGMIDQLTDLMKGHPFQSRYFLTNVLPMASIPGLIGQFTASLLNGNNLWDVYGPAGAEAETKVISMMSKIAGYDHQQSWGYTTWGGQGAVFTGLRLAIAKYAPSAVEEGVPNNLYVFSSEQAHYSLLKSAEATGIGRNHVIKVRTKRDHSMDEDDLQKKMEKVIEKGGIPIYIVATTGTTDNFGIDNIQQIYATATQTTQKHLLPSVHIHADSALGGFYAFFNEYDFSSNPLGFDDDVLAGLAQIRSRMQYLHLADSLCFDFQKLGQTPYVTSLFLVKNKHDLSLIDLDAAESPYVGNRGYGEYHTSYTLECSRMASSISILAALQLFGVEGYQVMLANYIQVNLSFRKQLNEQIPHLSITNPDNPGPVTAFRLYDKGFDWDREASGLCTKEQIIETNDRNEALFEYFGENRAEIFLGDTKKFDLVPCSNGEELIPVYVSKMFTISPYTEIQHVPDVINFIKKAIKNTTKSEVSISC
ncbi:pyridoxal phosphate-dependent decarboxylase family protein [Salipaludibacillus daqingensis]|uniref:pyridoxal phosphate-dependent decarboxylase family protein n=1 Tax=Salipaludibacillus daqingensis TaxID=3041001 RepID=UPI0024771333|nr:pyridoxal-dependent decarboxylase [Salipaludibacillus daqingensis]